MALDAIVTLEELGCLELRELETRVEPYIWPVLIWVDDTTIANPAQPIRVSTISVGNARTVIRDSMRAGETAPIPASVGTLRMRFDETVTMKHLILVVALLENDETPVHATRAGFQAFVSELTAAVTGRLFELGTTTGEERAAIVEEIKEQVSDAVTSAVKDDLTTWEKVKVLAGTLNLDDAVGAGFVALDDAEVAPGPITMAIEGTGSILGIPTRSRYELRGRLQIQRVEVDRCQEQVRAVNEAQAIVNGIEQQIQDLQDQLSGGGDEPPLPKDFLIEEIDRLREEELGPAMAALDAARAALLQCRVGTGPGRPLGGHVAVGNRFLAVELAGQAEQPEPDDATTTARATSWQCGDCQELRWPNGAGTGVHRRACTRQVQRWVNGRWIWVTESKIESCGPAVATGGVFQA